MADNSTQGGADTIRDKDRAGVKTQVFGLDVGIGTGTESLMSAASPLPAFTPDVTASGTLTAAAQTVTLALNGNSGAAAQITGTWVGTLQWEGTVDGTTWVPINAVAASTTGPSTTTTVNGLYRLTPSNLASFRVNCTAFTSGTVVVTLRAGAATGGTFVTQYLPTDITRILGAAVSGTNGLPATQIASTIPATTIMQNAAVAVGNGTNLNVAGYASIIVNITGTFVATVVFEASVDDTTFVAIAAHQVGIAGNLSTTTTNAGDFRISVAGYKSVRTRISAFTSGAVTAKGYTSPVAGHPTTINANIVSNSAANQSVNTAQVAGTAVDVNSGVKSAGTMRVVLATDQPALTNKLLVTPDSVALPANQSVNMAQVNGVATTTGSGVSGAGVMRVAISSDTGGTPSVTTTTNATLSSAATTNATLAKGGAGNLYSIAASNVGAAAAFLKIYNKASAPTVGTDVPVLTIPIAASAVATVSFGTQGFRFATGIAFAITMLVADSDTTAIAAAQVKVMVAYI